MGDLADEILLDDRFVMASAITPSQDDEIDRVPLEDVEQIGEYGGDAALEKVRGGADATWLELRQ
jgi:hypothetical protein